MEKGQKYDVQTFLDTPDTKPLTDSLDAKSSKRSASRSKTVDGIKVAIGVPKHVRPGRKIKGGMETTVKIDVRQHPYGVKIELTGFVGDIVSVYKNGLMMIAETQV